MKHCTRLLLVAHSLLLPLPCQGPELVLLGAPALGAPPVEDPFVRPVPRSWPEPLDRTGSFQRSVTGRITGHGVPDVVVLDGTRPLLASAPGIHRAITPLPRVDATDVVRDLAILTGQGRADGSHPALDALVLVGDEGLRLWRRDPVSGQPTIATVAGAAWQSVILLATHPADASVIYGIDAAGNLRVALRSGLDYVTQSASFPPQASPLALSAIDWDGDGQAEVAVLTTAGLRVFDRNANAVIDPVQHPASCGRLALVRNATTPPAEMLAWLTPDATFNTRLRVHRSGASFDLPLYRDFVALAAGDLSGDGQDELFLSTTTNEDVTMLVNLYLPALPALPPFLYDPAVALRIAIAAAGDRQPNLCAAAIGDFDGDGDGDLYVAVEPDAGSMTRSTLVLSKLYDSPSHVAPILDPTYEPLSAQIARFGIVFNPPPGGTHIELVVWQDQWKAGQPTYMLPAPVQRVLYPLQPGEEPQHIEFDVDRTHLLDDGLFFVMLRPVLIQHHNVVEVAEAWLGACAVTLEAALRAGAGDGGDGGGGGPRVGGITPQPDLPPPPDEEWEPPSPGG